MPAFRKADGDAEPVMLVTVQATALRMVATANFPPRVPGERVVLAATGPAVDVPPLAQVAARRVAVVAAAPGGSERAALGATVAQVARAARRE